MARMVVMAPGWEQKVEAAARPYLNNAAEDIGGDVKRNLRDSGNVRTGRLLRSVEANRNQVRVGTDHWQFVEFGTHPHLIRATKGKKSLANNMGQFFGKVVRHPGTRAYSPIRRAVYKRRRLRRW